MSTTERKKKRVRYRRENGKTLIEIKVRNARQLFDFRDPSPFRERDLDDEFVEYLVSSSEEFGSNIPIKIRIHISEDTDPTLDTLSIIEAFRAHFDYEVDLKRKKLRKMLKTAQSFLGVGLVSLVACLGAAALVERNFGDGLSSVLREGLVICGWVAMWRPIELALYDWWPLLERARLLDRLGNSEIDIRFDS